MNMVWTYDSHLGTMRCSTVENTGAEQNFYSVRQEDGSYFDDLDNWLTSVESAATAPYRTLLGGDFPTGQARMDFAVFVASLYARSPAMIRAHAQAYAQAIQIDMDVRFSTRKSFNAFMDKYEADTGAKVGDRERLFAFWNDKDRFCIEISQKRGLAILGVADKICEHLFERHWYLVQATEGFFITSDSPVFRFVEPSESHRVYGDGGFKNPASEITFPLSPQVMLLITSHRLPQQRLHIPAEHVWAMNGARAYQAERFLYAHVKDERIKQLAAQHKDDRHRMVVGWSKGFAEVKITR